MSQITALSEVANKTYTAIVNASLKTVTDDVLELMYDRLDHMMLVDRLTIAEYEHLCDAMRLHIGEDCRTV